MSTSLAIVSPDAHLVNEAGKYEWSAPRVQQAWDKARAHLRAVLPDAKRLVLMVGVPGAGKSTWLAAHGEQGAVYFDATLCGDRARAEFVTLARSMGKPVEVVWLDTPLAVCLARNAARTPDRQVPEGEVRKMADKLSRFPPRAREGFTRVTRVRHPDQPYKYRGAPLAGGQMTNPYFPFDTAEERDQAVLSEAGSNAELNARRAWASLERARLALERVHGCGFTLSLGEGGEGDAPCLVSKSGYRVKLQ
jgi:predicted kinase